MKTYFILATVALAIAICLSACSASTDPPSNNEPDKIYSRSSFDSVEVGMNMNAIEEIVGGQGEQGWYSSVFTCDDGTRISLYYYPSKESGERIVERIVYEAVTVSADAISQITVGMTMSQVLDILSSSGTSVGSGEIIIQYACDDGAKYNIVYLYDAEVDSLVVWKIVKS